MTTQTQTLAEQAAALRDLKLEKDRVTAEAKELKAEFDQAQHELFERMDFEGVGGIKLDELGVNFVRAETQYGTVQDRSEFVTWAEDNQPELLETKERKGLLNELVRQCLDNGEPLPPGIGFYVEQYISQRSA